MRQKRKIDSAGRYSRDDLEKRQKNNLIMYKPVIGLEIHTELKTETKMFCGCLNDPEEKNPNVNVCPICLAHPGTLPVINKKAVEFVLKLGMALGARIPERSKFDRKNYFYPDLPKGYQISQYDQPLVLGGELNGVKITRVHLEEDTGRLLHAEDGKSSLVDFNRAGVPLMELVTEPDIKTGEEAMEFAKELQLIMRYLGISDADMEKGQMRVEANISLAKDGERFGTKVEIKNLNSFRAVGESIDFEIKRQAEILDKGDKVHQETRGWNEFNGVTVSQRSKEEAHDYRYFPEPDLPVLVFKTSDVPNIKSDNFRTSDVLKIDLEKLKMEIPELPKEKRARFVSQYGLNEDQARVLAEDGNIANYFEKSASELMEEIESESEEEKNRGTLLLFNYLDSDIKGLLNEQKNEFGNLKVSPENFADLIVLIMKEGFNSRLAKDILREMFLTGLDPRKVMEEKGLEQISSEDVLSETVEEISKNNLKAVEDFKKGKTASLQFLIGQAMAKLKGQANPDTLKKLFEEYLNRT
jgi:aspartyl-tRNA(Asn)/glutamyl-tRNA(Gln) amidotransferase subunit B